MIDKFLNKEDVVRHAKSLAISLSSIALMLLGEWASGLDLGTYRPYVVGGLGFLVNAANVILQRVGKEE